MTTARIYLTVRRVAGPCLAYRIARLIGGRA